MTKHKQGFTLVEILVSLGVFVIVGAVVFSVYHFSYTSYKVTSWKQEAQNYLKLNNVFWQKYLSGATNKLTRLDTDAEGVVIGTAEITEIPFKIKNGGSGDLLADYAAGVDPVLLWYGQFHVKDEASMNYQTVTVEAHLSGTRPNVTLHGKVKDATGKVVRDVELLRNLVKIDASVRPYDEEYASSLRLVFTVQDPRKPENQADGVMEVRINTDIESL